MAVAAGSRRPTERPHAMYGSTATTVPAAPDAAALSKYEDLLAGASQLVLRNTGVPKHCGGLCRCSPGEATITIDVDEKEGALILDVKPGLNLGNACSFSTELKLGDGRVVLSFATQTAPQKEWKPPGVVAMDRDGPVSITDESQPQTMCSLCDPYNSMPKTSVTHPQSNDEALRNGQQLTTPKSLNAAFDTFNTFITLPLAAITCCAGPVFLFCCLPPPSLHSELKVCATRHV